MRRDEKRQEEMIREERSTVVVFLFYKLIYCRYKTSKIQVLNLTFEILIRLNKD